MQEIKGVYVPFWMFDGEAEGWANYKMCIRDRQRPQTPIWARDEELERSVSQKELWSPLRALRRRKTR